MYTDYNVDEISEAASCFEQNILNIFEEVEQTWESVEEAYFYMAGFKEESLSQTIEGLIDSEYHKQELFVNDVNQNKMNMSNLESTIQKLKVLESKKEVESSNLEQKVTALREKIQSSLVGKENICKKRDAILTYKLLTKIDFVYTTKKISGLVTKQIPETFTLSPQELSQEEITQKLWELIVGK